MAKVFTDMHHHALLQSLIMLFEGRLGFELYRPIGMDWYINGFWNVYPHPATAEQYLAIDSIPQDGTAPLNNVTGILGQDIFYCNDVSNAEKQNTAITLNGFINNEFDILIASLPQHIEPFKQLIAKYQPQAKLIYQIGNQWNIDQGAVKNVMASAKIDMPKGINGVIYHQEFDLNTFYYEPLKEGKKIYSFINCLNTVDIYKKDWELFLELEKLLPDWEFKSYGGQCRDGAIHDSKELADKMREATFIFHCKSEGDGYGHVIHNAAAIGRPLITRKSDYIGKLAEPLITPSTSLIVDGKTPHEIAEEIKNCYPENLAPFMFSAFKDNVDFDKEEKLIREFLGNLV